MTTAQWRTEAESYQPLTRPILFTHVTTGDVAENAVTLAGRMSECVKLSFVVELPTGSTSVGAYVNFDATAVIGTSANRDGMFVPANSGYFEENIFVSTRISVITATAGQNVRIRGALWGR